MSDHTLDRIGGAMDLEAVKRRMKRCVDRVEAAREDMRDRFFGRAKDGVNPVSDIPTLHEPSLPEVPDEWKRAVANLRLRTAGYYLGWSETQTCPDASATPAELVAAIRAGDAYADECERIAREYKATVARAVEEHIRNQTDAVGELTAIVGSVANTDD